jgi:hypothetical protein
MALFSPPAGLPEAGLSPIHAQEGRLPVRAPVLPGRTGLPLRPRGAAAPAPSSIPPAASRPLRPGPVLLREVRAGPC